MNPVERQRKVKERYVMENRSGNVQSPGTEHKPRSREGSPPPSKRGCAPPTPPPPHPLALQKCKAWWTKSNLPCLPLPDAAAAAALATHAPPHNSRPATLPTTHTTRWHVPLLNRVRQHHRDAADGADEGQHRKVLYRLEVQRHARPEVCDVLEHVRVAAVLELLRSFPLGAALKDGPPMPAVLFAELVGLFRCGGSRELFRRARVERRWPITFSRPLINHLVRPLAFVTELPGQRHLGKKGQIGDVFHLADAVHLAKRL